MPIESNINKVTFRAKDKKKKKDKTLKGQQPAIAPSPYYLFYEHWRNRMHLDQAMSKYTNMGCALMT